MIYEAFTLPSYINLSVEISRKCWKCLCVMGPLNFHVINIRVSCFSLKKSYVLYSLFLFFTNLIILHMNSYTFVYINMLCSRHRNQQSNVTFCVEYICSTSPLCIHLFIIMLCFFLADFVLLNLNINSIYVERNCYAIYFLYIVHIYFNFHSKWNINIKTKRKNPPSPGLPSAVYLPMI